MKGGKQGRPRRTSANNAARSAGARPKPGKGGAKRAEDVAPKKGSRKKSFGGRSSTEDEGAT